MKKIPRTPSTKRVAILAHKQDRVLRGRFCSHFADLQGDGLVELVDGTQGADCTVVLLSPSLISSPLGEIPDYLVRNGYPVILVRLREVSPRDLAPFGGQVILPRDGQSVSQHSDKDRTFCDIVSEVEGFLASPRFTQRRLR